MRTMRHDVAEHRNQELVEKAFAAYLKGDFDGLGDMMAEDLVWHVSGRSMLAGSYRGRDEVFGYFRRVLELTRGAFAPEGHDILGSDDHAIVLMRVRGSRMGRVLDARLFLIVHVREDRMAEVWESVYEQYEYDEFWS